MNVSIMDYNHRLRGFINSLEIKNRSFEIAVQSTVQLAGNRIFVEGKKSDGSQIGQYNSTTPLYINPLKSPSAKGLKPTKGKAGEHTFKNGKDHKTSYVPSYKAYRKTIGRKVAYVNLVLSGDMQSDFRNAKPSSPAKATKINANMFTTQLDRQINQKKMAGMNEKYGMISNASKAEIKNINFVATKELLLDLKRNRLA